MKHSKYKEQCSCCGKYVNDFDTSTGKIVCGECMDKNGGKKELEEPVQTDIFEYIQENIRI